MLTTERITDPDDAPVYAVRVDGAPSGEIRHRWGMWVFHQQLGPDADIIAADHDLDRLTARLPRLLCQAT